MISKSSTALIRHISHIHKLGKEEVMAIENVIPKLL